MPMPICCLSTATRMPWQTSPDHDSGTCGETEQADDIECEHREATNRAAHNFRYSGRLKSLCMNA
jgi:hypothetical protein